MSYQTIGSWIDNGICNFRVWAPHVDDVKVLLQNSLLWNLVKYTLGSHDDCGDQENGDAENGLEHWDHHHRYFVDLFGGRDNWHARSKSRLAWVLNIAMPGTPMMIMGSECL